MKTPIIKITNLSKYFFSHTEKIDSYKKFIIQLITLRLKNREKKKHTVLSHINLQIHPGEFVGIMGRNGVGKSTILKLLSKIYFPNEGSIVIHGRIASVLELGSGFEPELTGYENIFLNAAILGYGKKEIEANSEAIIQFAELGEKLYQPVKNYSSGMLVRLGFSISAHLNADIFLFDEVLAVGDIEFQQKCIKKIKALNSNGKTVILITHDPAQIEQYCSRCVLIDRAQIVFDGSSSEGAQKYKELFN